MRRFLHGVARTLGRLADRRRAAPASTAKAPSRAPARTPAKASKPAAPVRRPAATASKKPAPGQVAPTKGVPTKAVPSGRHLAYAPQPDGQADPGEVVWTWVAYEDDPRQGKDRPVLVVGREGRNVLGLMLSSQADRDGQRNWLALGPGAWDRQDRPSWVRLDRVLRVAEDGIRREGAVLDRARFKRIATALRRDHGWR